MSMDRVLFLLYWLSGEVSVERACPVTLSPLLSQSPKNRAFPTTLPTPQLGATFSSGSVFEAGNFL